MPGDYGDWTQAVEVEGPPVMFWNFGLMPIWGERICAHTSTKIIELIGAANPPRFLTVGNGLHETGPGDMRTLLQLRWAEVRQRLGYALFNHPRSVAQPHGALQLTKLRRTW